MKAIVSATKPPEVSHDFEELLAEAANGIDIQAMVAAQFEKSIEVKAAAYRRVYEEEGRHLRERESRLEALVERSTRDAYVRLVGHEQAKALLAAEERASRETQRDWEPVQLDAFWDDVGAVRSPEVADLFYSGVVNVVYGASESGKTWLALIAAEKVLAAGGRVVMLDFEDRPESAVRRLRLLGVNREALERFTYVNPSSYDERGRDELEPLVRVADLVIIDATTEALAAMGGLSSNSDVDIAGYMTALPKWAARLGPGVVVIDHATKESTARGMPEMQGSQHKRSAVEGVAYALVTDRPFSAEDDQGHSWVYVSKDKHGGVKTSRTGKGKFVGHLRGGPAGYTIEPPSPSDALTTPHDPVAKAAANRDRLEKSIVDVARKAGRPLKSRTGVVNALRQEGIKVRNSAVTADMLAGLVGRGLTSEYAYAKPWEPPPPPTGDGADTEEAY